MSWWPPRVTSVWSGGRASAISMLGRVGWKWWKWKTGVSMVGEARRRKGGGILASGQAGTTCPSGGHRYINTLCANHALRCS